MMRHHQQFKMTADKPEAAHIAYRLPCWIPHRFDEITGHSILHCDGDPWKHSSSTWNHVSTCYRSKVITASGFAAAILIYVHEYTKSWSHFNPNGSTRLDYVEIGCKILVIASTDLKPKYKHFRFFDFSAAIFDLSKSPTPPLKSVTLKTWGQPLGFHSYLL